MPLQPQPQPQEQVQVQPLLPLPHWVVWDVATVGRLRCGRRVLEVGKRGEMEILAPLCRNFLFLLPLLLFHRRAQVLPQQLEDEDDKGW